MTNVNLAVRNTQLQSSKLAKVNLEPNSIWGLVDECRRDTNRTPDYQIKALCAYALGRSSGSRWAVPSGLSLGALSFVSACAAVGDAGPRVHLLPDGQRKHQRGEAQFHSQFFFPIAASEPGIWSHPIGRMLFFADNVRRCAYATS